MARYALRTAALGYLALLLAFPVGLVVHKAFGHGVGHAWAAITSPDALHALWLTLVITAITVPANAVFGIAAALVLVRGRGPVRRALDLLVDLPFAVSPVVVGLALLLLYGRTGWLGPWFADHGWQIVFSLPGMVLATIFVSLPYVAREVAPVLREIGVEQEEAAETLGASAWQTFRHVTLPAIRWGLGYGIVLTTARALGEFGAVSVVSGKLAGETQTLPLFVVDRYDQFDETGAYAASLELALIAIAALLMMTMLERRREVAR